MYAAAGGGYTCPARNHGISYMMEGGNVPAILLLCILMFNTAPDGVHVIPYQGGPTQGSEPLNQLEELVHEDPERDE